MSDEATILLAGGTRAAWVTIALLGAGALLMLALAALLLAFHFSPRSPFRIRFLWLGGVIALAAAGFFAGEISLRFTRIARIDVHASGVWTLRAQTGRIITRLAPETGRSLSLWAETRIYTSPPYGDDLHGIVHFQDGREYRLRSSSAFDLLLRLGYGDYWLDHTHMGTAEEARARAARARMVFTGSKRKEALVLPFHSFFPEGVETTRAFLAGRASGPL